MVRAEGERDAVRLERLVRRADLLDPPEQAMDPEISRPLVAPAAQQVDGTVRVSHRPEGVGESELASPAEREIDRALSPLDEIDATPEVPEAPEVAPEAPTESPGLEMPVRPEVRKPVDLPIDIDELFASTPPAESHAPAEPAPERDGPAAKDDFVDLDATEHEVDVDSAKSGDRLAEDEKIRRGGWADYGKRLKHRHKDSDEKE